MTKLEPARTSSDLTATERLRELLDERGVEWERGLPTETIVREPIDALYVERQDGRMHVYFRSYLTPEQAIAATLGPKVTGNTSDGYHTFNELYHHRAVLFSVIVRDHRELAWKSRAHHDGTMYDGMFIVGIETPQGQATYHYDIDPYWDMFDCRELGRAPEWDGHTPSDAIERIATLGDSDATGERQCDAAEVVRCRDCACFSVDDSDHDYRTGWWCKRWYTDMVMPDGFCAWGRRADG